MSLARRQLLSVALTAVAAPAVARLAWGETTQVTLKLHHFASSVSHGHARFLLPWARKLEADSGGRIKIALFPSMQLGGSPAQLYDQARDGRADIVWAVPSVSPGRFPIIETFELPFLASPRAVINSQALQEFAQAHLGEEFGDVHPLCFWTHDRDILHARRQIAALQELDGLKVHVTTRLAAETVRALGAHAVGMPAGQVPQALGQKIIDGCAIPWEAVPALRIQDLIKFHTEVPGSPTLLTTVSVLAMNKASYAALPADLKAVVDDNSGQSAATLAGRVWDDQSALAEEAARKRGNAILTLATEEVTRWRTRTEPVIADWLNRMKERGHDGGRFLDAARGLIAKLQPA